MKRRKRRYICALITFIVCVLCFILQGSLYQWLSSKHARFVSPIAEENTVIRLQSAHKLDAPILFIGSSLTERLLSRRNMASIAMPGSPFTCTLKFLKNRKQFNPGTIYILEINNMFANDNKDLLNKTEEWDFLYFRDSSHFSLAAKPVNLIVSVLFYALEHGKNDTDDLFDTEPSAPVNLAIEKDITKQQLKEWDHLLKGIQEIRARGGRICFVNHPCKQTPETYKSSYIKGRLLAKHLNIPVLNYNHPNWIKKLDYTDSTHLRSRSKSTVMYMNTVARDASLIAVH